MKATNVLLGWGLAVFCIFFFHAFVFQDNRITSTGLQVFEVFGAAVCLYLLSKGRSVDLSWLDFLVIGIATLSGLLGFAGCSLTLFGVYLLFRDYTDLNTKAAGTVAAAVAIQAIWAPFIFSKVSFWLLQLDASLVGSIMSLFVAGSSWSGTIVATQSGHEVMITAPCASFHNLSLASLCWVALTMLHRPYWVKNDIYVGLLAMLIQFLFNIWRLIFVCLSLSMYQFWHDGLGKHIFSGVATAVAIAFVQLYLNRSHGQVTRGCEPDLGRRGGHL